MERRKACSFATEAVCSLKVTEHFVPWETIIAIAMTEPSAGSDLQRMRTSTRRDGEAYLVNGAKTIITNGQNADRITRV